MGPKDQGKKLSTPSDHFPVTHRLPGQQGQDYLEDGYVYAWVRVRTRVLEGMQKWENSWAVCEQWGR